mmetsp:Transcript_28630/g.37512  ORF Transcript_28630/g.37512 Transcript_28630/m.37512 type:complete len:340 (+) Transcript_28630:53-1072(+)
MSHNVNTNQQKSHHDKLIAEANEFSTVTFPLQTFHLDSLVRQSCLKVLRKVKDEGNLRMLSYMIQAYPNCPQEIINEIFIQHVCNGSIEAVKLLLENQHLVHKPNIHYHDDLALEYSIRKNNLPMAKLILEFHTTPSKHKFLPLVTKQGNIEMLKLLLSSGANLHVNSEDALRRACSAEKAKVVKFLLQIGAQVSFNTFLAAVSTNNTNIVKLLLPHSLPDPPQFSYKSLALFNASMKGNITLVAEMMKHRIDQTLLSRVDLECIARAGQHDIVLLLARKDVLDKLKHESSCMISINFVSGLMSWTCTMYVYFIVMFEVEVLGAIFGFAMFMLWLEPAT